MTRRAAQRLAEPPRLRGPAVATHGSTRGSDRRSQRVAADSTGRKIVPIAPREAA